MKTLWIVLISVLVAGGLAGSGAYYYVNQKSTTDKNVLQAQITDLNKKVTDTTKSLTDAQTVATAIANTTTSSSATITLATLKYSSYVIDSKTYKLSDGTYKSGNIEVTLDTDNVSIDNASTPAKAAVILKYNDGGTGVIKYLVMMKANGALPQYVASELLGDRVQINSIKLVSDLVSISELTFAATDPSCCPSVSKAIAYKLSASDKLVLQ